MHQSFASCKGIRNPESNIILLLESGIQGFGIWNPVPGIRNPTRGIRNPTSSITLESRSEMYCTVSSNFITNHHVHFPSASFTLITITEKCLVAQHVYQICRHCGWVFFDSWLGTCFIHAVFYDLYPPYLLNGQHHSQLYFELHV